MPACLHTKVGSTLVVVLEHDASFEAIAAAAAVFVRGIVGVVGNV